MIKKILVFWLITLCYLLLAGSAQAKEFSSFYKTTYKIDPGGQAFITQEVSLINLTAEYYVSEYTLSLLGGKVENIEAFDQVGPLKIETALQDENTLITLHFNEKVVGRDKMLSFIIKYRISDLVKKEGNLWQINIPKLAASTSIDEYQLMVVVSEKMGKIAFVNPTPRSEGTEDGATVLKFEKDDLTGFGALITVGQYQTFNFTLNYELKNDSPSVREEKIALPPDTDYQEVYYLALDPKPLEMEKDADGNWLAGYRLKPQEKLSIKAEGQANIFFEPKNISSDDESLTDYLKATKYWPAQDPKIVVLAQKLKTPKAIYRYVVDRLSYDYQSIKKGAKRKGALAVLEDPTHSICSDFTDLFITLCRAAGIPGREMAGFAYSDNPKLSALAKDNDLLHSWPEYYDRTKKAWVMVDPTWENTSGGLDYFNKFDLAHFVFVIHGQDDSFPLSPGSYKVEGNEEKQVYVGLGKDNAFTKTPSFSLSKVSKGPVLSLKKNQIEAELINESGFTLRRLTVKASSTGKIEPFEWSKSEILPFAKVSLAFSFLPKEFFRDYSTEIVISLAGQEIALPLTVTSSALRLFTAVGVILIILLGLVLWRLREKKTCQVSPKSANL